MLGEQELIEIELRCTRSQPDPRKALIEGRDHESGDDFIMTGQEDIYLTGATDDDHDFIANAKQDIPRLIAETRRLKRYEPK